MIRSLNYLFLFLLVLAPSACKENQNNAPLKFKSYEHNPILTPGDAGSWDELFVSAPRIIYYDSTFYLFYMGSNIAGKMAEGLATSEDGLHFTKIKNNPVLAPSASGFDAYTASAAVVLKNDLEWLMYYNANELATYAPGPFIGRATANHPAGEWIKDKKPVIQSGRPGEWDAGFIIPGSVVRLDDGTYRLYYTGGVEISDWHGFFTGMASSGDGISWTKYNDPATTGHPFAESDPVLMPGRQGEWDDAYVWLPNIEKFTHGFRMYYAGARYENEKEISAIGYAESSDGIHWNKYRKNPVFTSEEDPAVLLLGIAGSLENPSVLYLKNRCFMYYDFTLKPEEKHAICVATADLKTTGNEN